MVNHIPSRRLRDPEVLDLLGDPTRRRLVVLLAERPRHPADLARELRLSRPAISRHLRLLRSQGLLDDTRGADDGRTRLCRLRPAPLDDAADWLHTVQKFWATQLAAFGQYVAAQRHGAGHEPSRPQRRRRRR